jgi:uncharacterized membrane protein
MKEWIAIGALSFSCILGVFYLIGKDHRHQIRKAVIQDCTGEYCRMVSCAELQWMVDSMRAELEEWKQITTNNKGD